MSAQSIETASDIREGDRRRWLILSVLVVAQFMVVLDVAIVNVALPTIKNDLHFTEGGLQWVITAYAIVFGGVLLLGGRMADLLGRRRIFMVGMAVFTIFSLLDGLAWSSASLIAFRGLQGLGAALLAPAALSILTTTFREGRDRNVALGIWGAASGSGGAAGVLLGGALTSALSWSWIFFINVPVGILVLAISPVLLKESRADLDHRHFDTAGAASITGGLMLLVYALTHASQHGWATAETVGLLAASAALVVAFVVIEMRSPAPLLPLRIFRLRTLTASNITALLMGAAVFSQFFLLTLYMQQVLHYSALKTGVAYIALTLSIIGFSAVSQALVTRVGIRLVLPVGMALSAAGLVAVRATAGARDVLLQPVPGVHPQRDRARVRVRADVDRRAHRRESGRRRRGLRAAEHEPADRWSDRSRHRHDDRHHLHEPLPQRTPRRRPARRRRAHARLPDRLLRPRRPRSACGGGQRDHDRAGRGRDHVHRGKPRQPDTRARGGGLT